MAVDSSPLNVATLPAVLAGPVLRRLTRTHVTVWFALSRPDGVTLHVRVSGAGPEVTATASPVQVGSHLWLVAVTAPAPGGTFAAGSLYEYRASSPGWSAEPSWADLALGTALPAFPGLPTAIDDLVVFHQSCRKVSGGERDGLALAADVISERLAAADPNPRPHLLVHSGDQIYADENPTVLAPRVRRIADDLVGIGESATFGTLPGLAGRQAPSNGFGLTSSAAADHLWGLGEFYAHYLLAWSDVLWPAALPTWAQVNADLDPAGRFDEDGWNALLAKCELFRAGLPKVRKVLATVPSLMILDDHEVTDDWNLDFPWVDRVYAGGPASRIVVNGLLAYTLFQHWGNAPDRFATAGTAEAQVLGAATTSGGASPDTPALRGLLGVPPLPGAPARPVPAPPSALRSLGPGSMRYDVTLGAAEGYPLRVILLDERTVREFHRVDHPAARISLAGLASMLPTPPPSPAPATLVATPSPTFGTHIIEHVIQPASSLLPGGSEYTDFESWSGATANHQDLIARLAAYGPVAVLSGDVHYGFTGRITYVATSGTAHFAQLTSSAAKNADAKTMALHLFGELAMKLGIERARGFAGFAALTAAQRSALASPPSTSAALPYDEVVDIALGRVFRAGQEAPAVLSQETAAAYGLGVGDWHYEIDPVDDQTMPAAGPILTAIGSAPAPWTGWDPAKSYTTLGSLRAGDLHRIGRVLVGLPQVAVIRFTTGPPVTVHHSIECAVGSAASSARQRTQTTVALG
jgi:hypothetical protein